MKPMIRRLRALEQMYLVVTEPEREDSPVAILRARRKRWLEMEGVYVPEETRPRSHYPPGTTIAEILREGRFGSRSRTESAQ
jgi:hypothetical protein